MSDHPKPVKYSPGQEPPSLADMVDAPQAFPQKQLLGVVALGKIAVVLALLVALNYWQFPRLFGIWQHSPNWSHGFVIPLFSLYLLYVRRDELLSAPRRICILGLPLVAVSILFIILSFVFIHTHWLCNLGMIALLFSLVLYLAGPQVVLVTWLPVLFLIFAMPIPEMLYTRISVPLQELAARFAAGVLHISGATVDVTASALTITGISGETYPLTVAEACSGVRSLMAFLALGVAWAYLEQRPIWQRVILVLSAGPIAVLCNVIRVAITCSMYVLDKPELGQDFMHTFTGILMLGPALLMFWGLSALLRGLFVEVEDEDEDEDESQADGQVTPSEGAVK